MINGSGLRRRLQPDRWSVAGDGVGCMKEAALKCVNSAPWLRFVRRDGRCAILDRARLQAGVHNSERQVSTYVESNWASTQLP
jgi:hypothetical protein